LIDTYQLRQYNSTRALVDKPRDTATMSKDMLVMGNINYGNCDGDTSKRAQIETIQPEKGAYAMGRSAIFLDSIKRHWPYLRDSKIEIERLERSHKKHQPTAKFTAFTDYAATEKCFKSYGSYGKPSPPIMYISTHGYGNPTNYPESRYASAALHRAGLVMATANWTTECPVTRLPDEEDEILTAYEIAQLNLSNTELVVLSGCQTGLGDIWGREGVFGLTRGFKLAGVNHIIASLWEVNDAQTTEFMSAFYDAYLSGKSINTAFEETKKAMREKQPASSWAAWVLIR
jgi:CHAT domain-containing protein